MHVNVVTNKLKVQANTLLSPQAPPLQPSAISCRCFLPGHQSVTCKWPTDWWLIGNGTAYWGTMTAWSALLRTSVCPPPPGKKIFKVLFSTFARSQTRSLLTVTIFCSVQLCHLCFFFYGGEGLSLNDDWVSRRRREVVLFLGQTQRCLGLRMSPFRHNELPWKLSQAERDQTVSFCRSVSRQYFSTRSTQLTMKPCTKSKQPL